KPGAIFRQSLADLAIARINQESYIRGSSYELFNASYNSPVIVVVHVYFLKPGVSKEAGEKKGMSQTRSLKEFPVIIESSRAKLTFI
ncbi:hypothetical protein NL533_32845, partial [Klebsiella pneumoniae]|nr:hypothetical protein [Klebsiella pneumoniae]